MIDVSAFGTGITIVALNSFPTGFTLSQFADDVDPVIFEEVQTTDMEALYDGSFFVHDQAALMKMSVSVIPGSSDDINLKILLASRTGGPSLLPLPDITSSVIKYPDGGVAMMSNGSILKGPLADSVTSQKRKRSNTYTFGFGSYSGFQSSLQTAASLFQTAISFL